MDNKRRRRLNRFSPLCMILVFVSWFPFGIAGSQKILLYPSRDATIGNMIYYDRDKTVNSAHKHKGKGQDSHFTAQAWTNDGRPFVHRGFMAFDFATVPPDAVITRAVLKLYGIGHSVLADPRHPNLPKSNAAYLERVTSSWGEQGISWYTQPASTPRDHITLQKSGTPNQNYSIDITHFVRGWVNGTYENHGLIMRLQKEERYAKLSFASRDNFFISKSPILEIVYHLPKRPVHRTK